MIGRVLLTGGARSGKSAAAEQLLAGAAAVTYVATSPSASADPEWQDRVAEHRRRRPAHWITVETHEIVTPIRNATPGHPVLVDCLTLWLMSRMDHHGAWGEADRALPHLLGEIGELAATVRANPGGLVLVTNEVGSGLVPEGSGSRLFRDLLGRANSAVASQCDDVFLVVAGHFLRLERKPR